MSNPRIKNTQLKYKTATGLLLSVLVFLSGSVLANTPGQIAWTSPLSSPVSNPISIFQDRALVKTSQSNGDSCQSNVHAIDEEGDELWRYPTSGFCDDNNAIALSETGYVYVLDINNDTEQCGIVALTTTGQERFNRLDSSLCEQGLISTAQNGTVVFATQNGSTSELRQMSANGYEHWKVTFDFTIQQLKLSDKREVFVLADNGQLISLNTGGAVQQEFDNSGIAWRSFVIMDSNFLLVTTADDRTCKVDFNGNEVWCHQSEALVSSTPVIDSDNNVVIASTHGDLTALNESGSVLWTYSASGAISQSPVVGSSNNLYVPFSIGESAGGVIALNPDGSERWQIETDSAVGNMMLGVTGHLYVGTAQGDIYSIETASNGLAESSWPSVGGNYLNASRQPSIAKPNPLDFDGDFKTDLSIRRTGSGQHILLYSSTSSVVRETFGEQLSDVPLSGDFDGDGLADISLYRPSTGTWLIQPSSGQDAYCYTFGAMNNEIPTPADYDGDGVTDIAFVRPSTNQWIVLPSSTPNDYVVNTFEFDEEDIPIPADYDGDGKADMAVRRPSASLFIITQSSDQVTTSTYFGSQADDIAVPADYDGDGKADIAVRRPSSGNWFIRYSSDDTIYRIFFGSEYDDIPIPADYDGDGKADIAVRRLSSGSAFIAESSSDGHIMRIHFGLYESDIPLAAPINIKMAMAQNAQSQNTQGTLSREHTIDHSARSLETFQFVQPEIVNNSSGL